MKKTIPILLSAALLLSACGQAAGTAETTSADAPAAVTETTAQTSAPKTTPGGVDKAETVYAKADAGGTVTETTVETVLKARDGATIEDVAALRDIINKEGDEAYTTGADNALTWENSGNAITYEGKSDAALPVTTRATWPGRAAGCASALTTPTTPARPSRWMGRSTRSACRLRPSQR